MNKETSLEQLDLSIIDALKESTITDHKQISTSENFITIFLELFLTSIPFISETEHPNQSNWTYHTAFTMRQVAQFMGLNCIFETLGRLDAVIQTFAEPPERILVAEWEANYRTIFNTGKELDKLWAASSSNQVHAFLLTYTPTSDTPAFIKSVVDFWQSAPLATKFNPILYLVVMTYTKRGSINEFEFLMPIEIHRHKAIIWSEHEQI